ncbi:MAG: Cas10/Cmr2 second palm domain-containing protein [Promethearchaeota archaeon]
MEKINAILIEIGSIQDYIFSSNRLKHVIGASYIIKRIFEIELREALEEVFPQMRDIKLNQWEEFPSEIKIIENSIPFEIGYIGGGNALLFIKEKEDVKKFVQSFTRILLKRYPGVKTFFGISNEFDFSNFKQSMIKIHQDLKRNKNINHPIVFLPKHGFTAECPESGESAELKFKNEEKQFISGIIKAKILASEESLKDLRKIFSNELKNNYIFTNDFDYIGESGNNNYIAVVCIDGNKIGDRFRECNNLTEIRNLSSSIKEATLNAFKEMLKTLIQAIENGRISEISNFELKKNKKNRLILPFIPIIIGGDDITFVCNGKLALFLTEKFIENFIKQTASDGKKLTACAGISIVKTKYPFFKAYSISRDLLKFSKKQSREQENSCYLDFFVSSGGFSGEYEDILKNNFQTIEGLLHFGPYRLNCNHSMEVKCFLNLKNFINIFKEWPRNKLMEFRELLFDTKEKAKRYIEKLKVNNIYLPKISGKSFHNEIWENKETPYFDAIEILNFYPKELL